MNRSKSATTFELLARAGHSNSSSRVQKWAFSLITLILELIRGTLSLLLDRRLSMRSQLSQVRIDPGKTYRDGFVEVEYVEVEEALLVVDYPEMSAVLDIRGSDFSVFDHIRHGARSIWAGADVEDRALLDLSSGCREERAEEDETGQVGPEAGHGGLSLHWLQIYKFRIHNCKGSLKFISKSGNVPISPSGPAATPTQHGKTDISGNRLTQLGSQNEYAKMLYGGEKAATQAQKTAKENYQRNLRNHQALLKKQNDQFEYIKSVQTGLQDRQDEVMDLDALNRRNAMEQQRLAGLQAKRIRHMEHPELAKAEEEARRRKEEEDALQKFARLNSAGGNKTDQQRRRKDYGDRGAHGRPRSHYGSGHGSPHRPPPYPAYAHYPYPQYPPQYMPVYYGQPPYQPQYNPVQPQVNQGGGGGKNEQIKSTIKAAIDNQTKVLNELLNGVKEEKNTDGLTKNKALEIELKQFEREAALKREIMNLQNQLGSLTDNVKEVKEFNEAQKLSENNMMDPMSALAVMNPFNSLNPMNFLNPNSNPYLANEFISPQMANLPQVPPGVNVIPGMGPGEGRQGRPRPGNGGPNTYVVQGDEYEPDGRKKKKKRRRRNEWDNIYDTEYSNKQHERSFAQLEVDIGNGW